MEAPSALHSSQVQLGRAIVEPARNRIIRGNNSHRVTRRDMEVLMYLIQNGTRVVQRQEILDDVWSDTFVNEEALTLTISRLRKAFGDDSRTPGVIETIPKRGYRLMVPATTTSELSLQRRSLRLLRSSNFWVVVLVLLLAVITSLFVVVRQEYEDVRPPAGEAVVPIVVPDSEQ